MADSEQRMLDEIADILMYSFPVFFRKMSREETRRPFRRMDPSSHVLRVVAMHGPVRMSEIGKHMGISKPYMTALVDKLIEDGFVVRTPDSSDRRVINIAVTAKGKEAVKKLARYHRETIVRNLSALNSEDIRDLHESMSRTRAIISKLEGEHDKGPGQMQKVRE